MSNALPIEDLSKTYLEHSMVINNFVIKIGSQIKDSLCRVFGDGVQYEWRENDDKVIIPDVSIICNLRDRKNISFTGIPRFVMEVLSNATEEYDRHEKMNIYLFLFEYNRFTRSVLFSFVRMPIISLLNSRLYQKKNMFWRFFSVSVLAD